MSLFAAISYYIPSQSGKKLISFLVASFLFLYTLFLLFGGFQFLIFLIVGFALGSYNSYNSSSSNYDSQHIQSLQKYEQYLIDKKKQLPISDETEEKIDDNNNGRVELSYPPLTNVINPLLDCIMKDYVLSWWDPLNIHHDVQFQKIARERLNLMVINVEKILMSQERNDIVMSVLYGLANTLIIHMRECRALEESNLSIEQFIFQNPQSPFAQLLSTEEQQMQLRNLSTLFLKRTLPNTTDTLLTSLFTELLATYLFGGIIDTFSDPDYLNAWIVDLLKPTITTTSTPSESDMQKNTFLTPPATPEPSTMNITNTTQQTELQSSPSSSSLTTNADTSVVPAMIFPLGTVNFTIMDISQPSSLPPNKSEMLYIIQIERPAAAHQQHHSSSEGGGYVITRTFADFESFHTLLSAKHFNRIRTLQLKLPSFLASSPPSSHSASSLLQKGNSQQTQPKDISQELENYIDKIVQDEELGTEPIILSFLGKESQSKEQNVSFAEEYKAEVANAYSILLSSSLSSNSTSLPSLAKTKISSSKISSTTSATATNTVIENGRTSTSSIRSNTPSSSSLSLPELPAIVTDPHPMIISTSSLSSPSPPSTATTHQKQPAMPLSTMDVELLIETTYALVIETFQLSAGFNTTNKKATWMRRSILNLLREIVRRSYTQFISEQYNDFVEAYISPDAIVHMLDQLQNSFWPDDTEEAGTAAADQRSSHLYDDEVKERGVGKEKVNTSDSVQPTTKTNDKQKQLARELLMTELIPSTVRQLIGDQNCNMAMHRIWARCQDPQLNRVLILQILERIVKPILG
ncbi:PXA domain-containing protein [Mycotypha africana]|uniref:PXA domain-containing protein n=1 Tax=Mycotypha africana TaxID=64632 RepID=UPI002300FD2B|nr:PXA domain-containing protein [Mycotypha africana]KAI8967615.1 PXA domain-containing protein [Mycotypha africana]